MDNSFFGYGLTPSATLDLSRVSLEKFEQLCRLEPDVRKCMACGSCAASCTAGRYTIVNLRRILLYLQRGREKEAVAQIRHCMLCGKCLLVCPRGINTRNLILAIGRTYDAE